MFVKEKWCQSSLCHKNDTLSNKSLMPVNWQNTVWGIIERDGETGTDVHDFKDKQSSINS